MPTPEFVAALTPVVTREQQDLIKRTVAVGATDDELALYLYDCARRGVHPLDNLIYFGKRNGRYRPMTSIDYFRATAHATGELAGIDDAVYKLADPDTPLSATVTCYRLTQGQRYAYTATARLSEYKPASGPSGGGDVVWKRSPFFMTAKCAEALALRKGFPQELGGLHIAEELSGLPTESAAPRAVENHSGPVDTTTGEELPPSSAPSSPPPPSGYRYIDALHEDGEWTHVLFYDAGRANLAERYKTKIAGVAKKLRLAYAQALPVALDVTRARKPEDPGYVNGVEIYRRPPDLALAEAVRDMRDDPPA